VIDEPNDRRARLLISTRKLVELSEDDLPPRGVFFELVTSHLVSELDVLSSREFGELRCCADGNGFPDLAASLATLAL